MNQKGSLDISNLLVLAAGISKCPFHLTLDRCFQQLRVSGVPRRNPNADRDELHVLLFIFILRGTGLLSRVGRRGCDLRLLCCLLHLQPLLLSNLCLLLPCLHTKINFIAANTTITRSSFYYVICFPLIVLTLANNSCCCLRSSSSGMPRFSRRELAFLLFKATVLHSCSTSFTSVMYEPKPRLSRAAVLEAIMQVCSFQHTNCAKIDNAARTVDHMLWRDGLFVGLVADFIGF